MVKNLPASAGDAGDLGSIPGSGRSPGGGKGNPVQYFLPGESHGQRSLAGHTPWGRKELDTTERPTLSPHFQAPGLRNVKSEGKQLTRRMMLRLLMMTKPYVYLNLYGNRVENYPVLLY